MANKDNTLIKIKKRKKAVFLHWTPSIPYTCSTRWKVLLNKEFCDSNYFYAACCLSVSTVRNPLSKLILK